MMTMLQRPRRLRTLAAAGFATTALLLTGCSMQSASSNTGEAAATQETVDTDGMSVGVVFESLSHPIMNSWAEAIEGEAESYGWTLSVQDGERNAELQTSQVESFISQGVDLIVLQAVDSAALSPVVTRAENEGIPVITLNQSVEAPHTAFVGMGHYEMGVIAAEGLIEQIGGSGNIVIIEGLTAATANRERLAGFESVLEENPDVTVVAQQPAEFDRRTAYEVFGTILRGQPEIDGVFAMSDEMAIGAGQAAVEAGRKDGMYIWGADGSDDMFAAMRDGQVDGDAAVDSPTMGRTVAYLAEYILSSALPAGSYAGTLEIPPTAVTLENLEAFAS